MEWCVSLSCTTNFLKGNSLGYFFSFAGAAAATGAADTEILISSIISTTFAACEDVSIIAAKSSSTSTIFFDEIAEAGIFKGTDFTGSAGALGLIGSLGAISEFTLWHKFIIAISKGNVGIATYLKSSIALEN